jgi:FAD/FMN-containing dehydrogenase
MVRVEAGKKLIDLEAETVPQGWEMRFHPSTRRTATIGGFIAGGSGGVGSINYGGLRERGNVAALRLVTLERSPRIVELRGDEVQQAIHAYGTNGIITELEIAMAPAWPWVDLVVAFPDIMTSLRFGQALAEADAIVKKLITPIEWGAAQYFKPLRPHLPAGRAICIAMIAAPSLEPFRLLAAQHGGSICFERAPGDAAGDVPPLYEFTWNHTTLHALKADRTITYLQTRYPPPDHLAAVEKMIAIFGDEVPIHAEFVRDGGQVCCIGLQLVRFTTPGRLAEIIRIHEEHGCRIFNPHTCVLEDGGMKTVNEEQLAFKRRADPMGLMNPGKMRAWEER